MEPGGTGNEDPLPRGSRYVFPHGKAVTVAAARYLDFVAFQAYSRSLQLVPYLFPQQALDPGFLLEGAPGLRV